MALLEKDPELYDLLQKEKERQLTGITLIASENITSEAVLEATGSVLCNKYSEGLPGKRYYGGNEYIDQIENLCIKRAKEAFRLGDEWSVNVQPYSGSVANLAVYNALLEPGDKLMGLDLPSGGHLTHGYQTAKRKISVSSIYYQSQGYQVNETGYIDYDQLELQAQEFQPKLIICGASAYPRDFDYHRFRIIADSVNAYLMCDMAHISGLVATEEHNNPFDYCDVVTTTTHKTLRGPRGAMIFCKRSSHTEGAFGKSELADQINFSVFPSLQGGPHNNKIGALAVQLKEVQTEEFKQYVKQVKLNAKIMGECFMDYGYKLMTDGTDNHLILVDLKPLGLTGSKVEKACDKAGIYINKNSVYGDRSALSPGGIRLGSPYMTTLGFMEEDFAAIAKLIHICIQECLRLQDKVGKKLKDFVPALEDNLVLAGVKEQVEHLCERVRKQSS